ncbi:MAG: LysR family transcriptional regulator [Gordonibacter sp.]|uniref:LysR family transcriptional regulator n=3 Tax=Gordonibacter sp. TaxID=1968902 RepID=UPI002FCBE58F
MRTELLREFVVLANYGNFHVAAEKLFISQPTLSNHVKALESELGFELFDRTCNNELTAAGSILLDGARSALSSIDAAAEDCRRLLATEPSPYPPVRLSVFASRDRVYSALEALCPFPYTYPKYEMRKPLLYDFVQDRTDIMCAYHLDRFPDLKVEVDQMGLHQAYFGKDTCAIAAKASNPLAKGEMTRERLRGAKIAILSSSEFVYWKLFLLDALGSDLDLAFYPFSIETPDNLRIFDLKDMLLVAPTVMIDEFFACRSDYVAHSIIDGEPLLISESIVWRPSDDNPNIERIVALLLESATASEVS